MNTIELQTISYPVFKLPSMPNVEDGVIFYYSETEKDYVTSAKLSIVDDTNVKGETLAARRLQLREY